MTHDTSTLTNRSTGAARPVPPETPWHGATTLDDPRNEVGRRLGFDLFGFGRTPQMNQWPADVREGYAHAWADRRERHAPDRFERKWLQLRMQAHQRDRVVDEAVTPTFLRKIDVDRCPVTRERLTHGTRGPSDWSIDRVNNDGAYAPRNLAVMSVAANAAKGRKTFDDVLSRSTAHAASEGLEPIHWLRLAGLMLGPCFATDPKAAPTIPLAVTLPRGLVLNGMQQIQHVFAQWAVRPSGKNALIKHFSEACGSEVAKQRLSRLAEAVHRASKGLEHPCDAWLCPATMEALTQWRDRLDDRAWGFAGEIGRHFAGARRVGEAQVAAWHLETRGYRAI